MAELVIHIGSHKTGTTTLQDFFVLNRKRLCEEHGVLYPETGRRGNLHHPVFQELFYQGCADLTEGIRREAALAGANRVLLSSEFLSRRSVGAEQLAEIKKAFAGWEIKIVVYLRRQDAYVESVYAERVKRGRLSKDYTVQDMDLCLDYYRWLDKYESVFGTRAITVREYELAIKWGLCQDFLECLGIIVDEQFIYPNRRSNERLPWSVVAMLHWANSPKVLRKLLLSRPSRRVLTRLKGWFPQVLDWPRPLGESDRRRLVWEHEKTNALVANKYLGKEQLFQAPSRREYRAPLRVDSTLKTRGG